MKEPIKFQKVSWNGSEPKEDKKNPVRIQANPWGDSEKQEQKRKAVEFDRNPWNQIEKREEGNRTIEFGSSPSWQEVQPKEQEQKKVEIAPKSWNQIDGLQPPTLIRSFEGINTLDSFSIKDSQATKNKNISNKEYPALSVREGYHIYNTFNTARSITGLAVYKGQELHVITDGAWQVLKGGVWTTLKTGLNLFEKWSFINFQGNFPEMNLIATNGIDPPLRYDGTNVVPLANAPAVADFVATHDNRVYIAAMNTVYYSALRKAEDWNTVGESGSIVVETSDGKQITGIVAGSARLTVFKENSIHELFGTRPDNYTMKTVTESLGSPTGNSAQVIDGVIYFLGFENVYRYSGGSLPDSDFALPVRKYIQEMKRQYVKMAVSWTKDNKYYLAIPKDSAVLETILEYDPSLNMWNAWEFAESPYIPGVVINDYLYIGTKDGHVYEFNEFSDYDDNGVPIAFEWETKPFSLSSLAQKSRWYKIWITAKIMSGSTLNIHISDQKEGTTWTLVKSITGEDNETKAREIFIPVTAAFHSNWLRLRLEGTGRVFIYEIARQERVFPMGQ